MKKKKIRKLIPIEEYNREIAPKKRIIDALILKKKRKNNP